MSFDTYISLIIGDIFLTILSIVVTISQTKSNKVGKRQLRIYKTLIAILILVGVILTVVYTTSSHKQKVTDFEQQISDAQFDLENHAFLDAAEHYHQAFLISYNSDTQLQAVYGQGMSYYLYGLYFSDKDYYRNAATIYSSIIKNPTYQAFEYYIDAIADLSLIYRFLEYAWDDPALLSLIGQLEDIIAKDPLASIEQISSNQLSLRLKVVSSLAMYYEYASRANFENILDSGISAKALQYYDELNTLYQWTAETQEDHMLPSLQSHNISAIADSMLTYAITSSDPLTYCNSAIELCETELRKRDPSITELIELKKVMGKALFFLSVLLDDQQASYSQQAYDLMRPMINIEDDAAKPALMDLCYYLVRTDRCSEEELDIVLDIYEYNLSTISVASDTKTRVQSLLSASSVCKYIAENYSFSARAVNVGLTCSEELTEQLQDYLNDDQLLIAEENNAFFSELNIPSGYQIMLSSSHIALNQCFTVTVLPNETTDTSIMIYAKDPTGSIWEFPLDDGNEKTLYVDQESLTGEWLLYADVSNEQGTYYGKTTGPYAKLNVE